MNHRLNEPRAITFCFEKIMSFSSIAEEAQTCD